MPHRIPLLNLLQNYLPADPAEQKARRAMLHFVSGNADCFARSNLAGHITASCWLVSPDARQVLLTHHKKIGQWLQLGGHADGEQDALSVALKEAEEESGIAGITPISPNIFDVDIHLIAPHLGVPAHYHYDIRFALQAPSLAFLVSDESLALAWLNIEALLGGPKTNDSIARMARKWLDCQEPKK